MRHSLFTYIFFQSLLYQAFLSEARPIQCTQGPARLGCIYLQGFRNRRSVLQSSSLPPLINGSENSEFSNPTPVSTRSSTESSLSTPPPISTNQASSNFPPPSPPPLESGIPPLALRSGSSPQPPQSTGDLSDMSSILNGLNDGAIPYSQSGSNQPLLNWNPGRH